jgi:hypothetical protein
MLRHLVGSNACLPAIEGSVPCYLVDLAHTQLSVEEPQVERIRCVSMLRQCSVLSNVTASGAPVAPVTATITRFCFVALRGMS